MDPRKKAHSFPIEEKLAAIEWNLKLLNTSMTTTHTPLCTLKSMIKADVVLPTKDALQNVSSGNLLTLLLNHLDS